MGLLFSDVGGGGDIGRGAHRGRRAKQGPLSGRRLSGQEPHPSLSRRRNIPMRMGRSMGLGNQDTAGNARQRMRLIRQLGLEQLIGGVQGGLLPWGYGKEPPSGPKLNSSGVDPTLARMMMLNWTPAGQQSLPDLITPGQLQRSPNLVTPPAPGGLGQLITPPAPPQPGITSMFPWTNVG